MSINLELPTAEGLKMLAPHKTRKKILEPMRLVQTRMMENRQEIQLYRGGATVCACRPEYADDHRGHAGDGLPDCPVAQSLYDNFDLKRVFYSAFVHVNDDAALPARTDAGPPLLREHRLYQADWAAPVLSLPGRRTSV